MRKIFRSLLKAIVAVGFLSLIVTIQFSCSGSSSAFDKELVKAASELNAMCPMMVDSETRLDNSMSLPGKIFQYNYTLVNTAVSDIDVEEFINFMEPNLVNNAKTNPQMQSFRDYKVTMEYNYKDKDGKFITTIKITPDQYID